MTLDSHTSPILVTGANGFVGSWVTRHLLQRGYLVRAMVRTVENGGDLVSMGAEVVIADLKDRDSLMNVVAGCGSICHIAALFRDASLPDSEYFAVNVEGVRNLFEAAIETGVDRIVHCSTNGVHGNVKELPCKESSPFAPADLYQESKVEGEKVARSFYETGKIKGAILRPAMIYGPDDTRILKLFRMVARKRFFYIGKGNAMTHWIDVRDLARAFELALKSDTGAGEAFLIAGNPALPLNEMCSKIANQLGVARPWVHLPVGVMLLAADICEAVCKPIGVHPPLYRRRVNFFLKSRYFDTSKAKEILGFAPSQNIDQEISDIIDGYRTKGLL